MNNTSYIIMEYKKIYIYIVYHKTCYIYLIIQKTQKYYAEGGVSEERCDSSFPGSCPSLH